MSKFPSIVPNPIDEIARKLEKMGKDAAKDFCEKLKKIPQAVKEVLVKKIRKKQEELNAQVETYYQSVLPLCKRGLAGPHIQIEVPTDRIKFAASYEMIPGKAIFFEAGTNIRYEADCAVACGHWHKLGEIRGRTINVIDHLDKLLPPKGNRSSIGLITFQNGMMNNLKENFRDSSQLISSQFPERPLCIGLYNPTTSNIIKDMFRFISEARFNKVAVYSLAQMIKTFADLLPKISPNTLWTHFAHSEGGLIANAVFDICSEWNYRETRDGFKKHMITATYGAVQPIADEHVLAARNTYTKNDIALFFGKNYIDKNIDDIKPTDEGYISRKIYYGKTYQVRVLNSTTEKKPFAYVPEPLTFEERVQLSFFQNIGYQEMSLPHSYVASASLVNEIIYQIKDHGFTEDTYKNALKEDVKDFRRDFKIYNHMLGQ